MTTDESRSLALSLPEATEAAHMNIPDSRVRGTIFATLGPDEARGMVKPTPTQALEAILTGSPSVECACVYNVKSRNYRICREQGGRSR
jgi:hypothetical protein